MNIQTYNEKCQDLAELAKQALALEGLDQKTTEELERTRTNILANHYRITLLGSFQSGKSTIFNVACGGRELSPTGIGIRTSAVPAEAHVTADDDKEYANVLWKNDAELLSGFIDAVLPELRDLAQGRLDDCSEIEIVERLDLGRVNDRELISAALRDARKHLHEDSTAECQAKERNVRQGDMTELLKIGDLTLHFYHAFLEQRAKGSVEQSPMTVEAASQVVRFPENWTQTADARSFRWEDVRFLFAKTVQFFLKSEDLRQLRAVLVDCPGLHASRWDNEIVHHCIAQSDAVIWLQGGEGKELGQSDLEEARQFGDYGITSDGVFLAFNARGVTKRISERILHSNLEKMKTHAGIEVPPERVVIFNALLALRARQAMALEADALSQSSLLALSAKAKDQIDTSKLPDGGADPLKNARKLVERDLKRQAAQFLDDEIDDPWNESELKRLAGDSQWEQVISQATQFIVRTKGRTRLIDKGAHLILKALERFEEGLKATEIAATDKLEDHKAKKAAAESSLEHFETGADALVRRFEQSLGDTSMEGNGVGGEVQDELHARLRKGKKGLRRRLEKAIDEADQERQVRKAIREEATTWMRSIITGWQVDVRAGKSTAMNQFYNRTLSGVEQVMQRLLEEAIGQGAGFLKSVDFEIPKPSDHLLDEYQAEPMKAFKSVDYFLDMTDALKVFKPLRDGYEALRRLFTGQPFDREAWRKRIEAYLEALTSAFEQGLVEQVARDFLKDYQGAVVSRIDGSKQNLRKEYEETLRTRESELAKSQEERAEMAKRAKDVRKRVIKPFQERLRNFIEQAESAMMPDACAPVSSDNMTSMTATTP